MISRWPNDAWEFRQRRTRGAAQPHDNIVIVNSRRQKRELVASAVTREGDVQLLFETPYLFVLAATDVPPRFSAAVYDLRANDSKQTDRLGTYKALAPAKTISWTIDRDGRIATQAKEVERILGDLAAFERLGQKAQIDRIVNGLRDAVSARTDPQ